jgi:two-component system, NarL family, response regulator
VGTPNTHRHWQRSTGGSQPLVPMHDFERQRSNCGLAEAAKNIRVLCVDDHRVMLDGLSLLIGRQPDMDVIAATTLGEDAVDLFRRHRPDVTLMDLQLPTMSGLEAIREIRAIDPDAKIVVLTMYQGDEDIYRALEAGAAAYLLKDTLSEDLVRVIREVQSGSRPIPSELAAVLAARRMQPSLTPREVDVIRLIAQGMRNKEIGVALGISEWTAKVHVKNILAKLGVSDRAAVIQIALRRGIIHIR